MTKMIGISLMQEKPCAAVFQDGKPVLIPSVSKLPDRMACAKADAAEHLGNPAMKAIVVVPSFYTLRQKDRLIKEARKASLEIKRFISPCASAALMDLHRKKDFYRSRGEKRVLICSLIGGNFDAAAAVIDSSGTVDMLATTGIASTESKQMQFTLNQLLAREEVGSDPFHRVLMIGDAYYVSGIQVNLLPCVNTDTLVGVYGAEDAVLGAAIHCGTLEGPIKDLLLNITPHSLGIQTDGGVFTPMIIRGTTYPACQKLVVTNAQDNQANYEICLYEGEQEKVAKNTWLTCFQFAEIPPCPKGTARIEVSIDLDPDCKLTVTAKDLTSGKTLKLTRCSHGSHGLLMLVSKDKERDVGKTAPVAPSDAVIPEQPAGKTVPLSSPETPVPSEAKEWILKFLPVYDDLSLALEQPTKDEAFKKGVRLTIKKLTAIFTELGAEFYGHRGETFDPKLHDAVMHIESPQYGENTIVKVLQKGVKLNGTIIRYAMVQVAN